MYSRVDLISPTSLPVSFSIAADCMTEFIEKPTKKKATDKPKKKPVAKAKKKVVKKAVKKAAAKPKKRLVAKTKKKVG